jgi:hypothetical protein
MRLDDLTNRLDEIEKVGRRASPQSMMLPSSNRVKADEFRSMHEPTTRLIARSSTREV